MKLGALIREIYDISGPIYGAIDGVTGKMYVQLSKQDLVKTLRSLNENSKSETGYTIRYESHGQRYFEVEKAKEVAVEAQSDAPSEPVARFEDVSEDELANEDLGTMELQDAPEESKIVYGAKFNYETRLFEGDVPPVAVAA